MSLEYSAGELIKELVGGLFSTNTDWIVNLISLCLELQRNARKLILVSSFDSTLNIFSKYYSRFNIVRLLILLSVYQNDTFYKRNLLGLRFLHVEL